MLNTQKQRISANIFQRRAKPVEKAKDDAGVRQDKIALTRDRTPSRQPALYKKLSRSQTTGKKTQRTQMKNGVKKRTVELSLWVNPVVKAELARLAERNGLSLSATGGALLERALQENIDMEYGALLEPAMERAIDRHLRKYHSKIALLLVRVLFSSEQTRNMQTEVLHHLPDVSEDEALDKDEVVKILDWAANLAKSKITWQTPELAEALAKVDAWFMEEPEETEEQK